MARAIELKPHEVVTIMRALNDSPDKAAWELRDLLSDVYASGLAPDYHWFVTIYKPDGETPYE
jgi:hypothetical protein